MGKKEREHHTWSRNSADTEEKFWEMVAKPAGALEGTLRRQRTGSREDYAGFDSKIFRVL